jgi:5-formyltetrahydrofolate cyclo-ligase
MSPDLAQRKSALRREIGALASRFSRQEAAEASPRICEQLRPQPLWRNCRHILSFFPMPGEPDIRPLLEEALEAGKTLLLPWFDPGRREYDVRQVATLADLRPGHFGILEPAPNRPKGELFRLDFCLVPGVAYDVSGRRLGRGRGYFDRLLADVRGHKCGVAFEWQVVAEVPTECHDVRVDSLLTPARWLRC